MGLCSSKVDPYIMFSGRISRKYLNKVEIEYNLRELDIQSFPFCGDKIIGKEEKLIESAKVIYKNVTYRVEKLS